MKKGLPKIIILIIVVLIAFIFVKEKKIERTMDIFAMDTISNVTIVGKNNQNKFLEGIKDIIIKYDNMFSFSYKNSDVYKINNSNEPLKISYETIEIIKKSEEFYNKTNGRFDITVGNVFEIWNDSFKNQTIPDFEKIKRLNKYTGYKNLKIDEKNQLIKKENLKITLGAVAKGYISDKICEYINENNIENVLVNLGGNIYAKGKNRDNKIWNIGIKDANNSQNIIGTIPIDNKFVVTSGDYERYIDYENKRYHHIIDAKTGIPVFNDIKSVTIIADNGFLADALSTSCFIKGFWEGKKLIKEYGVFGIIITKDNKIYYSSELEDDFKKTNTDYEYIAF